MTENKNINAANILTFIRVALIPLFVLFMELDKFLWAAVVFIAASLTDYIDGMIARKFNLITELGKFLDPLADKALVISALVCFAELKWTYTWVVITIIIRELAVSGIRMLCAGRPEKIVIAADMPGKIKTMVTMLAVIAVLLMQSLVQLEILKDADFVASATAVLMYISVALTVWSGFTYLWKYRFVFNDNDYS